MTGHSDSNPMHYFSFHTLAVANHLGLLTEAGLEVVAGKAVLDRLDLPEELSADEFSDDECVLFRLLETCHSSVEIFTAEPSDPHGVRAMFFIDDDLGVFAAPADDGWEFSAVFRLAPCMDRLTNDIASENVREGAEDAFVYPVDEFANLIAIRSELLSGELEQSETPSEDDPSGDAIDLDRVVLGRIVTLSRTRLVRGASELADSMLGAIAGERVRFIGQPNQMFYANPIGGDQFLLHRLEPENVRALLELTLGADIEPPVLPVSAPDLRTASALEQGGESVSFDEISVSYLNNIGVSQLEADVESPDCPAWKRALLAPEIVISFESTGPGGHENPTKYISIAGTTAVRWVQSRGITQCDHFSVAQVRALIDGWLANYLDDSEAPREPLEFSLSSSEYQQATKALPESVRSLDVSIPESAGERGVVSLVFLASDGMVRGDELSILLLGELGGFMSMNSPNEGLEFVRASSALAMHELMDSLRTQAAKR